MQWERRWLYELRWEPGHRGGVLSREVENLAQLRAVVEWARSNPNVIKCSYRPVDHLEGEPATTCSRGHPLGTPDTRRSGQILRDTRRVACVACPGHDVSYCSCGERVIEPPPAYGCAAVRPAAAAAIRRGP